MTSLPQAPCPLLPEARAVVLERRIEGMQITASAPESARRPGAIKKKRKLSRGGYRRLAEKMKALRARRRAEGLCRECEDPATSGPFCAVHRIKWRLYGKNKYRKRRAKKLCIMCGGKITKEYGKPRNKTRCPECAAMDKYYQAKARRRRGVKKIFFKINTSKW